MRAFPKWISVMWKANSPVQDLNSCHPVLFLRRKNSLHDKFSEFSVNYHLIWSFGRDQVIFLYLKIPENFLRLIFSDWFCFVHLPFGWRLINTISIKYYTELWIKYYIDTISIKYNINTISIKYYIDTISIKYFIDTISIQYNINTISIKYYIDTILIKYNINTISIKYHIYSIPIKYCINTISIIVLFKHCIN